MSTWRKASEMARIAGHSDVATDGDRRSVPNTQRNEPRESRLPIVFALGSNSYGCLGAGELTSCLNPVKITELSGKAVQSFAYGERHVLALTGKGEVYGWGENETSQVGRASPSKISTPVLVYNGEDPALEIACGYWHSVCRTMKGAVYSWGDNNCLQTGIDHRTTQPAPCKVEKAIANLKCTGISCRDWTTVAVFEHGEVFLWGRTGFAATPQAPQPPGLRMPSDPGFGQLSSRTWNRPIPAISRPETQEISVRVDFGSNVIRKVACGSTHTLALDLDGSLYAWGKNDEGQLGSSSRDYEANPIRDPNFASEFGRILDVAASGKTSAALTENLDVLMWGSCEGCPESLSPKKVPCKSILDVFATLTTFPKTPVPLIVASMWTNRSTGNSATLKSCSIAGWDGNLANTVAEHFDNPAFSDVKFFVFGETIHAHKLLLNLQSEYFRKMFQTIWKDNKSEAIEVTGSSYAVYRAFVRYFYTGEVDLPLTETIELLSLTHSCSENALKTICQRRIESMISIDNCASIYMAAVEYGAGDLEESSFRFAEGHLTAVTQTSGFAALPEGIFKRFFAEVAKKGAFKS